MPITLPNLTSPVPELSHPHLKPYLLSITFTLLLTFTWYLFARLSQPLQNLTFWFTFDSSTWKTLLILLLIQNLVVVFNALALLLITPLWLKLLPLFISPLVLYFFHSNNPLLAFILITTALTQFNFNFLATNDQHLYKKFSLSKLILPHLTFLFIASALIISLPLHFQLKNNPQIINQTIETQLLEPLVDQVSKSSFSNSQSSPLPTTPNPELSPPSQLFPGVDLAQLFPPELLSQLPNLLDQTQTGQPSLTDQLKTEMLTQITNLLKPITPYLPIILPLIVFFSILQILSLIRIVFYPLLWLTFQLILISHLARITTHDEPVEILEA